MKVVAAMKAHVHKQTHLYNRFALDVGHPVAALHRQSLLPACGIFYAVGTLTTALHCARILWAKLLWPRKEKLSKTCKRELDRRAQQAISSNTNDDLTIMRVCQMGCAGLALGPHE